MRFALLILALATPVAADGLAAIDGEVEKFLEAKAFAGAVTLVEHKGKIVQFKAYGHRDAAAGRPMQKDTIFRIYSMSKPVTSVAALMLVDDGKIKLDDPVAKHVPEFKDLEVWRADDPQPPKRAMTVRDLFCHTSGLVYGWGVGAVDSRYRAERVLDPKGTLKGMVQKLGGIPLAREPGTRWQYSVSADVLGYLVEVVSKQPLDVFLKERIFDPLEMRDTAFFVPKEKLDRFASNYGASLRPIDVPERSAYARPVTFFSGGGGLVSTATDYLHFCQLLLRGGTWKGKRLLESETVAAMTKNQLADELLPIRMGFQPLDGLGFGLGVSVRITESRFDPGGVVGDYGWGGAASTFFRIAPKQELIVITMTQVVPLNTAFDGAVRNIVRKALD